MNIPKIISNVAPFLGNMLTGPFSATAGKVIGRALLNNENVTLEEIKKAIVNATPEQLIKLKELDFEYKTKLAELGIDEKRISAIDRDNARSREIMRRDYVPSILALFLTLGFFGILLSMMLFPIQPEAKNIVNILLGSLGTAWIACISYYFGSSAETSSTLKNSQDNAR